MKKLKYIISLALLLVAMFSCNEDKWLKEVPLDFYSPDNSYTTQEQFNLAVANLYSKLEPFNQNAPYLNLVFLYTSDIAYDAIDLTHQMNSMEDNLKPEVEVVGYYWRIFYRLIFDANVIINRINNKDIVFTSEKNRTTLEAEARFFRACAYRNLGLIYGGVPIVLDEIKAPKRDFVRATANEVWAQCIEDFTFASQNLLDVTEQKEDGRLTKAAANHYLAELYIITKNYDKAISAASSVIDNPNYALMTQRFGTKKNEPGDVYGDLFRRGNQNRNGKGGLNTEAIWVNQYEYLVTGGGLGYSLTTRAVPNYEFLTGNSDKKNLFIGSTSKNGGKGMGWMVASDYLLNKVWENAPTDMRNSQYNIIRDITSDNPASAYYGKKIVESGAITNYPNNLSRWWSAIFSKTTPINDFPTEVISNPATGLVNSGATLTFKDEYIIRLAETYLLRAEAYLDKGDKINAAADINKIRARANASPVDPSNVTIDYILDERARELPFEEWRVLTLHRLNKLSERVTKYNPMYNGKYATHKVSEYHNLWPIPQSEIERNTEAVLEQNPGYK
jgi:hypothetical protein